MVIFFHVKKVSSSIYDVLKEEDYGRVHSVYTRTINIVLHKKIVALQPYGLQKTPMTISVQEDDKAFNRLKIRRNDRVVLCKNYLSINRYRFDIRNYQLWDPKLDYLDLQLEDIDRQTIKYLSDLLKVYGSREGLRDIALFLVLKNFSNTFAGSGNNKSLLAKGLSMTNNLFALLKRGEVDRAVETMGGFIGLGPGLTPSGDDFLVGFISILLIVETNMALINEFRLKLISKIASLLNKTTFLAGEFLKYSCKREFCQVFHDFFTALEEKNTNKILISTMAFIKLGHSSGSDSLSGIITGLVLIKELEVFFTGQIKI